MFGDFAVRTAAGSYNEQLMRWQFLKYRGQFRLSGIKNRFGGKKVTITWCSLAEFANERKPKVGIGSFLPSGHFFKAMGDSFFSFPKLKYMDEILSER